MLALTGEITECLLKEEWELGILGRLAQLTGTQPPLALCQGMIIY